MVAGEHVAESHGEQKIGHALVAEQLEADEQGADGAVGDAAEEGGHAHRRAQGRVESRQAAEKAPESGSDAEGGDDFPALVARPQRGGREEHLQDGHLRRGGVPLHAVDDQLDAGAVVALAPGQERQKEHDAAAREDPQVGIGKEFVVKGAPTGAAGRRIRCSTVHRETLKR